MWNYIANRLLQSLVVVILVVFIVFVVVHLVPGDPVVAMLGNQSSVTPEMLSTLRHNWGLDRPIYVQFGAWVFGLLRGDLGQSFQTQVPVSTLLANEWPATIELGVAAIIVSLLVAVPGGIISAIYENSPLDYFVTGLVTLAMSVPGFWVSIMLIYFVAVNHRWLPTGGYIPLTKDPLANLRFLILPAGTLGVLTAAPIMRYLRASLVDELRRDYVLTARSKGLAEYKVVFRHAVRNALIPTVTIVALQFGSSLIGGVVVMEYVFNWPGIGTQLVAAVFNRDYFVLQSTCLLIAVFVVILNLAVDIFYTILDPRIAYA